MMRPSLFTIIFTARLLTGTLCAKTPGEDRQLSNSFQRLNEMIDLNFLEDLISDLYLICLEQNWFDVGWRLTKLTYVLKKKIRCKVCPS